MVSEGANGFFLQQESETNVDEELRPGTNITTPQRLCGGHPNIDYVDCRSYTSTFPEPIVHATDEGGIGTNQLDPDKESIHPR